MLGETLLWESISVDLGVLAQSFRLVSFFLSVGVCVHFKVATTKKEERKTQECL